MRKVSGCKGRPVGHMLVSRGKAIRALARPPAVSLFVAELRQPRGLGRSMGPGSFSSARLRNAFAFSLICLALGRRQPRGSVRGGGHGQGERAPSLAPPRALLRCLGSCRPGIRSRSQPEAGTVKRRKMNFRDAPGAPGVSPLVRTWSIFGSADGPQMTVRSACESDRTGPDRVLSDPQIVQLESTASICRQSPDGGEVQVGHQ